MDRDTQALVKKLNELESGVKALNKEIKEITRALKALNTNIVQIGRIYKEATGTTVTNVFSGQADTAVDSFDEEETPPNA